MINSYELQFKLLLNTYFKVDKEYFKSSSYRKFILNEEQNLIKFYNEFRIRHFQNEFGYTKKLYEFEPVLENELLDIVKRNDLFEDSLKRQFAPSICLSHDIDYLKPTLQMKLKRLIHDRKYSSTESHYLNSLKILLDIDANYAKNPAAVTLFLANVTKSKSAIKKIKQWLLDPSYNWNDPLFSSFLALAKNYKVEFGIHGSFFSLEDKTLIEEVQKISKHIGKTVILGRQHWLRIPKESFLTIYDSGLKIDSTIGWNNSLGFRGGFARPYPILLDNLNYIWEVPLAIMDGALFGPMALGNSESVNVCTKILEKVKECNGHVSIDWHDRAASLDYGWQEVYKQVLEKAQNLEIAFEPMQSEFTKINMNIDSNIKLGNLTN
jgi:hypothetical protein